MNELLSIETALLDDDGSCRDVNFSEPTWIGVTQLVKGLGQNFRERRAHNDDGHPLTESHWRKVKSSVLETGSVHLDYRDSLGVLINLQIWIASEEDGSPFIELTFFPEDLAEMDRLGENFIAWVDAARATLQANRYFCRYENASWRFGDTSQQSGVFFASNGYS